MVVLLQQQHAVVMGSIVGGLLSAGVCHGHMALESVVLRQQQQQQHAVVTKCRSYDSSKIGFLPAATARRGHWFLESVVFRQ